MQKSRKRGRDLKMPLLLCSIAFFLGTVIWYYVGEAHGQQEFETVAEESEA